MNHNTKLITMVCIAFSIMIILTFFINGFGNNITTGAIGVVDQNSCNEECSVNAECSDNNACTKDICLSAGTCKAVCYYEVETECIDNDGCCPEGCTGRDNDC